MMDTRANATLLALSARAAEIMLLSGVMPLSSSSPITMRATERGRGDGKLSLELAGAASVFNSSLLISNDIVR